MSEYLRLEDLLTLVHDLGDLTVRDVGLLAAAAQRPTTTLYGVDAYPTLHQKAAVLLESLTRNHALIDGNTRLGWLAIVVFYGLNDMALDAPDDGAYELVIAPCRRARWRTPPPPNGWHRGHPPDDVSMDPWAAQTLNGTAASREESIMASREQLRGAFA